MEQTHRDGLNAVRGTNPLTQLRQLTRIHRFQLFTTRTDPPANAKPVLRRHQRRLPPPRKRIQLWTRLPADLQYIFEPAIRDQRNRTPTPLEERIGCDG
jgi:hypothetical protein